jgi:hypothetical protein
MRRLVLVLSLQLRQAVIAQRTTSALSCASWRKTLLQRVEHILVDPRRTLREISSVYYQFLKCYKYVFPFYHPYAREVAQLDLYCSRGFSDCNSLPLQIVAILLSHSCMHTYDSFVPHAVSLTKLNSSPADPHDTIVSLRNRFTPG